jgi:hypothetical protein
MAAAAGSAVAAYHYWTSPTYSLHQVRAAVDARDVARFEKYVDLRAICDSGVDRWLGQASRSDGRKRAWTQALAAGVVMAMKPAMVDAIDAEVRRAIEEGRILEGDRRVQLNIHDVVQDSRGALVWLVIPGSNFEPPRMNDARVQVRMRKLGYHWQAFEVVGLEGFE